MMKSTLAMCCFWSLGSPMCATGFAQSNVAAGVRVTAWKFGFGEKAENGRRPVSPTVLYKPEVGYGFEAGATVTAGESGCVSDRPFSFSAAVPEGNYRVTVILGDKAGAANTTVKAEARRLMLEGIQTAAGKFVTRSFLVNVRTPQLPAGDAVRINGREQGPPLSLNWDEKLTLEFNGSRPSVAALEITKVEDANTVFIAGDSTITDQANEPYSSWGQMLPRFFKPSVAVANYAESGLTLGSFRAQKRFAKVLSLLKTGDYVIVQFGHNDQKEKGTNAGPFNSYKTNLKEYVAQIRGKGGVPVLVTPMERRRWSSEGKPEATLFDFAEAVRQAGQEEHVPVIDLNAMSLKLYEAWGPEKSTKAFVHFPMGSFPGQKEALKDNTHFTDYGGYELARCVVEGIKKEVPALGAQLADDVGVFDPGSPDEFEKFQVPLSPFKGGEKPAGS